MSTLRTWQEAFVATLTLPSPAAHPAYASHGAFAVYRNTVLRGCLDALEANYPAIACLVGRDWFRAAAALYVEVQPPRDGRLALYGEHFGDFLARFEGAAALPYLADIARLDRFWTESFSAADEPVLATAALRSLAPDALAAARLRPHAACRTLVSAWPVVSIWQASRDGVPVDDNLLWQPEAALVTRVEGAVRVTHVTPDMCALLHACAKAPSLAEAAACTLADHPGAPIDRIFAGLLAAGAFASL